MVHSSPLGFGVVMMIGGVVMGLVTYSEVVKECSCGR